MRTPEERAEARKRYANLATGELLQAVVDLRSAARRAYNEHPDTPTVIYTEAGMEIIPAPAQIGEEQSQ